MGDIWSAHLKGLLLKCESCLQFLDSLINLQLQLAKVLLCSAHSKQPLLLLLVAPSSSSRACPCLLCRLLARRQCIVWWLHMSEKAQGADLATGDRLARAVPFKVAQQLLDRGSRVR